MDSVFNRIGLAILLIACGSVMLISFFNAHTTISFSLGAAINLIPTLLFGLIFFKNSIATAREILKIFYMGELFKIMITILLFIFIFQWRSLNYLAVFLGFITAHLGCLLALFYFD